MTMGATNECPQGGARSQSIGETGEGPIVDGRWLIDGRNGQCARTQRARDQQSMVVGWSMGETGNGERARIKGREAMSHGQRARRMGHRRFNGGQATGNAMGDARWATWRTGHGRR
mmetsp:Transcript_4924/g.9395  ORF Transcript_4924/g.9395 Transcript_4924/m.9395 type:complete len:116 (-) Transcript_4924:28-375(-)